METDTPIPSIDIRSSMSSRPGRPTRFEKAKNPKRAITRLLEYLLPFRVELILVTIVVIISSLLGLMGPWLMGRALDTLMKQRAKKTRKMQENKTSGICTLFNVVTITGR